MFPGLQMVVTKTRICKMAQDLLFSVKDRFIVFAGLIVMLYWLSQNYISKLQNMYTCLCKQHSMISKQSLSVYFVCSCLCMWNGRTIWQQMAFLFYFSLDTNISNAILIYMIRMVKQFGLVLFFEYSSMEVRHTGNLKLAHKTRNC